MRDEVKSSDAFVSEAAAHLVAAGGKRFRPLVTLLAAQFGDPAAPGVVPAAVVVELTHLATLYHDDVMDEARLRRGADSANSRWGNTIAILTGDFLFARASDVLADLGPEAVRLQARTFERLVQGQIHETVGPGRRRRPGRALPAGDRRQDRVTDRYVGAVRRAAVRRAPPTRPSCSPSGASGSASPSSSPTTCSTSRRSRPSPARRRARTCASTSRRCRSCCCAAQRAPEDAELLAALDGDLSDDAALADVLKQLRAHPVMEEAAQVTRDWGSLAREALAGLPEGEARDALAVLCDAVTNRRL